MEKYAKDIFPLGVYINGIAPVLIQKHNLLDLIYPVYTYFPNLSRKIFKPSGGLLFGGLYNHTCLPIKALHRLYTKSTGLSCNMNFIIKINFLQKPHRNERNDFTETAIRNKVFIIQGTENFSAG